MNEKINHTFQGKIWNTTFGSHYCVLEIRDETARQVSFSCINLLTGNILWKNLRPEKSWWLSLVGIFNEFLFVHKYSSNQKPEPEGLLVLAIESGEIIMKLDNWIFFNCEENVLTIYQLQNNQPIYKDIILEKMAENNINSLGILTTNAVIHYPENSPHFPIIFKFLYRLLDIDAVKAVDYLEISNKIIISYYIYRDKSFQNYLLVTNRTHEILLNDLMAESEGIGIDTFTVKSDTLLYVKNQNQFVGYRL